jgi:hypothetical protein
MCKPAVPQGQDEVVPQFPKRVHSIYTQPSRLMSCSEISDEVETEA